MTKDASHLAKRPFKLSKVTHQFHQLELIHFKNLKKKRNVSKGH